MRLLTIISQQINWESLGLNLLEKTGQLLLLLIGFLLIKRLLHWLISRLLKRSLNFSRQDERRKKTLTLLFYNVMDYALYFLLAYWILVILGLPISSLLAGASLAGLAIGLGAQGFLSDLINGIFILIERQYDVGETVKIGLLSGKVTKIGIRTTQLKDKDGVHHIIPNRQVTAVSNYSRAPRRILIDLPMTEPVDLNQWQEKIKAINQAQVPNFPAILDMPVIKGARVNDLGQVIFRVELTVRNGQEDLIYQNFFQAYYQALYQL